MPHPGLSISDSDEEGCLLVRLEGSARVETAAHLSQSLTQRRLARNVAIDWGGAEHVDACVLQVLLALRELLKGRGLSLTVRKDNAKVREYLDLSGLSAYFPLQAQPNSPQAGESRG